MEDIPDDPVENFAASPNISFARSVAIDEKGANFKKIFIRELIAKAMAAVTTSKLLTPKNMFDNKTIMKGL